MTTTEQSSCINEDALADLFAGGASAHLRAAIDQHLDTCVACRNLVAAYARAADDSEIDHLSSASTAFANTEITGDEPRTTRSPPAIGQLLAGRYLLEQVIGEGGMGVVWSARDLPNNREVALKMLKEGSPELARRMLREAKAAASVHHPALVEVIDVLPPADEGEPPILVMPLLRGESLDRLLAKTAPNGLGERPTLEILEPVISGMRAAHAHGVIHRDLKPPNIFLAEPEATVMVLDFGLAKILSDDGSDAAADKLTRTGALLGTPWYMAPEQLFGDASVDHRADVWAIGVMIYECISGKRPVEGKSYGQIARNVARGSIAPLSSDVNPKLTEIAMRMLDKDREGRPSLAEVHGVIRSLLDLT